MLQRDDAKGTNIHRFGDGERVPILHPSSMIFNRPILDCETGDEILSVLFSAAACMDDMPGTLNLGHNAKSEVLNKMTTQLLNG
jgi:hypothetical protein